jgi:hypothetical protein
MKSQIEMEQLLQRLGNEWPADRSLVDGVMREIESQSIRPKLRPLALPLIMKSLLAIAASLAVLAVLWWTLHRDNTLYAQAIDGIRRALTFHMTTTVQPDADKPTQQVMQSWYVRGVGFREEVGPEVRLGNQRNFWRYVKDSKLAIRSQSRDVDRIVDRMLDNETLQLLKQEQLEWYPAGDLNIDGQPCRAYVMAKIERAADPDWQSGRKRMVILLDDQSRIVRAVAEFRSDNHWVPQYTTDWKYDVQVDPALFEPHFGDDVRIVDADEVFDEFVDLQKAVYREERSGLWYAIHRADRFEGGGILVVSSVRGTAETLKKYPLTPPRPIQPGLFFSEGPADNYRASPQGDGFFRIDLATADYQGIDVRWWVLVPRGTPPNHFDVAPGKVKLPVGITPRGKFAKANFADESGVIQHLTWDIVLDLPEPKSLPTLDEIARRVYADQIALEAVPFRWLDMGPKDHVEQFSEPGKATAAEYSRAVSAHIRWWMENDVEYQLEGQFAVQSPHLGSPPEDWPAIGLSYEPTVDDATLARVAKRKSLKRLYLDGTKITDAGLRHLDGLKELRELSLENTPITDAGLKDLESLSALRRLDIQGTKTTAAGIARLQLKLPSLQIKQ